MKLNQIFEEFIHVVQENPDYIIGLLDKKGMIISCSIEAKNGSRVNLTELDSNSRIYAIEIKGSSYGYLWINGPSQAINMVGNILFDSLKTRIQYEINQQTAKKSLSVEDQIIKELLKEERSNYHYLEKLLEKVQFDLSLPRISIAITKDEEFDRDEIMGLKYKMNDKSTIYSLITSQFLLIFKSVPENLNDKSLFGYISDFINELIEWGLSDCYYAIGTIQMDLDLYRLSYKHCLWLKENISMNKDNPLYFEDYLFSYAASKNSPQTMASIFDYYKKKATQIDIDELIIIVEELYSNDFSVKKTAELLFLHKNTLLYKIKRYEELFSIDIRGSFHGKMFIYYLANFLKDEKSRKP
ncbi:PucR family transcriptional regulator [Enterococcus sp. LJL99]